MKNTLSLLCLFAGAPALAATGVCDPPVTTQACIDAIQQSGGVINDIFRDKNGRTGAQLPSFGTLFNIYPACGRVNSGPCSMGTSFTPFDCPGQYSRARPRRLPTWAWR